MTGGRALSLCPLGLGDQPLHPFQHGFIAEAVVEPFHQQREGEGPWPRQCFQPPAVGRQPLQGGSQPVLLQLLLQHLPSGLLQQQVVGFVLLEHVKQQGCADLQLAAGLLLTRHGLGDQTTHLGNGAKAPPAQL